MKDKLCHAFCAQLHVEELLSGWAVATPYTHPDGDPVMFFIMKKPGGMVRLEDDGAQLALLESEGINLDIRKSRGQALDAMLEQYGAWRDMETGLIYFDEMDLADAPSAALQFMALMLRIHDLALLKPERVRKTWQEDALRDIHSAFEGVATVEDDAPVSPKLAGFPADAVIWAKNAPPLAVFMATNDAKGLQALVLKMELERYQSVPCNVVLMVERAKENPLREPTYAHAQARLDGVLTYRGAEQEAMQRLSRWVPEGVPN